VAHLYNPVNQWSGPHLTVVQKVPDLVKIYFTGALQGFHVLYVEKAIFNVADR
jgi:hypothetical protein